MLIIRIADNFKSWKDFKRDAVKKRKADKINKIIEFPFEWIRKVTIPPCTEEEYDNYLVVLWPFFGIPAAMFMILKTAPTGWWMFYLIPAFIWAVCFAFKDGCEKKEAKKGDKKGEDKKEGDIKEEP